MPAENPLAWILFLAFIGVMLALDLGVFHKKAHIPGFGEALGWTAVWATLAAGFGGWLWWSRGATPSIEFFTGYVIELSLSMDNVFVFVVIFGALAIPRELQHRVLFWGILSALVLRGAMILGGAALIAKWNWILYVFGAFLLLIGVKQTVPRARRAAARSTSTSAADSANAPPGQSATEVTTAAPAQGKLLGFLRRKLRLTGLHGAKFVVRVDGRLAGTPLLLALIMVEVADVVFAVDSIPAIFAVTRDPYIVFTANVFAILGLRSLFFVLAGMVARFRHLKTGLGIVLIFVGAKLLLLMADVHISPLISLAVVVGVLGTTILWSLFRANHT